MKKVGLVGGMINPKILGLITGIIVGLILLNWIAYLFILKFYSTPNANERIVVALKMGRLAPLPKSIRELKVDGTENLFSTTIFIKFKASSGDIDNFVKSSRGLGNVQAKPFDYQNWQRGNQEIIRKYPWFDPVNSKGRVLEIPQGRESGYGTLIIDDERNIVYLKVSHS